MHTGQDPGLGPVRTAMRCGRDFITTANWVSVDGYPCMPGFWEHRSRLIPGMGQARKLRRTPP